MTSSGHTELMNSSRSCTCWPGPTQDEGCTPDPRARQVNRWLERATSPSPFHAHRRERMDEPRSGSRCFVGASFDEVPLGAWLSSDRPSSASSTHGTTSADPSRGLSSRPRSRTTPTHQRSSGARHRRDRRPFSVTGRSSASAGPPARGRRGRACVRTVPRRRTPASAAEPTDRSVDDLVGADYYHAGDDPGMGATP